VRDDDDRPRKAVAHEIGQPLDTLSLGDLDERVALLRAEIARLEAAIDQLPDEQKEVLTLAHLAGLSRAEIGAHMGKTEEAVRALLHRAKARLSILMGVGEP